MWCRKCGGKMKSDNRLGWCTACRYGHCAECGERFLKKEESWTFCPRHRLIRARARGQILGGKQMEVV